jgi:hypothetical protein
VAGPFFSVGVILLGFFCCALTSLAFGLSAVRALEIDFNKSEAIAIGYVIGSAISSLLIFGLGLSGLIGQPVFIGITFVSAAILWRQWRWFAGLPKYSGSRAPVAIQLLLLVAFAFYGAIYFRQAVSPEISPDGTEYHLGLVNLWTHAGRIYKIADIYAVPVCFRNRTPFGCGAGAFFISD